MGHVADGADVDGRLARDDLWRERRQLLGVDDVQVLLGQVRLTRGHPRELFSLRHGVGRTVSTIIFLQQENPLQIPTNCQEHAFDLLYFNEI